MEYDEEEDEEDEDECGPDYPIGGTAEPYDLQGDR